MHELEPDWTYLLKVRTFYPEAHVSKGCRKIVLQPHAVKAEAECEEDYVAFRWADVGPEAEASYHCDLGHLYQCRSLTDIGL